MSCRLCSAVQCSPLFHFAETLGSHVSVVWILNNVSFLLSVFEESAGNVSLQLTVMLYIAYQSSLR